MICTFLFTIRKTDEEEKEKKSVRDMLPKSLTEDQCVVRTKMENVEVQKQRAELVKAKSVHELSQITSMADIPIPGRGGANASAVERKKRFREK